MADKDTSQRETYSVRLRPSVIKSLRHLAIEEEKPLSELLEQAIEDLLAKHAQKLPSRDQKKGNKKGSGR